MTLPFGFHAGSRLPATLLTLLLFCLTAPATAQEAAPAETQPAPAPEVVESPAAALALI